MNLRDTFILTSGFFFFFLFLESFYDALKNYRFTFRVQGLDVCTLTAMFLYVFTSLISLVRGSRSVWVRRESSKPPRCVTYLSVRNE